MKTQVFVIVAVAVLVRQLLLAIHMDTPCITRS